MSLLANQRPRRAIEIVDASVQLYRAHALSLMTIAAIVVVPPAVIIALVPPLIGGVVNLASNLLLAVGSGAVATYVFALMTEGEISVNESFRRSPAGKVIGAQILYGLAVIFGAVLLIIPGVIFAIRFALAGVIAAIEKTDSQSFNRSWALTKGHTGHVFLTVVLGFVISMILIGGGMILSGMLSEWLQLDESLGSLLLSPLMVVTVPFGSIVATLLYVDLRVRNEAADISAMVAELPRPASGTPVA